MVVKVNILRDFIYIQTEAKARFGENRDVLINVIEDTQQAIYVKIDFMDVYDFMVFIKINRTP